MEPKTFLLAFPRSGSSFVRLCIAYLTHMRPRQSTGGMEPSMQNLLGDMEFNGHFDKFHYAPLDGPSRLIINPGDLLIHLVRDQFENVLSWQYSQEYAASLSEWATSALPLGTKDPEIATRMRKVVFEQEDKIVRWIEDLKRNQKFFDDYEGPKLTLEYERVIEGPEYLVEQLRTTNLEITDEAVIAFTDKFQELSNRMMSIKTGEGCRVNTCGDVDFWKNLMGQDVIQRFNELCSNE